MHMVIKWMNDSDSDSPMTHENWYNMQSRNVNEENPQVIFPFKNHMQKVK